MKLSKIVLSSLLVLSAATVAVPVATQFTGDIAIVQAQEEAVTMRRYYTAAHGDKAFTAVTVLLQGDKLVDAVIDEFQFVAKDGGFTGVPNSDSDFGAGYAEGQVLVGKLDNDEGYSKLMAEKAGSTVTIGENFKAIIEATKGKTADEILALVEEVDGLGEDGNVSDVVSGATLADTSGYLKAIAEAITEGYEFTGVEANADNLVLKQEIAAPHGTKSFALVSAAVDGDKVVASAIDEFQIVEAGGDFTGVPNSDADFGKGIAEGSLLISKIANNEGYSKLMTDKASSTVSYLDNLNAVAAYANGKTIEELKAGIEEVAGLGEDGNVSDVVSGATLADTANYLQAIAEVAEK